MGPHRGAFGVVPEAVAGAVVNPATIEATPFALSLSKGVGFERASIGSARAVFARAGLITLRSWLSAYVFEAIPQT